MAAERASMRERMRALHRRSVVAAAAVGGAIAVLVLLHFASDRLDPARHTVSEYVHGPYGGWATVAFLALAAGTWALGGALRLATGERLPAALVRVFSVSMLIVALNPVPGPGESGPQAVQRGGVHGLAAFIAFSALTAAMLVLGLRFRRHPRWRGLAWPTLILGLGALTSFFAIGSVPREDVGTAERVYLALVLAWLAAVSARMLRARPGE